jgi:AcrR family transcriptional regulator
VSMEKRKLVDTAVQTPAADSSRAHLKAFINRRRDPDTKREAVLRTAVRLFLERGFWRTSLSDVAEQLNITKPALYHYFSNKEEIYLACYRWGIALINADLERIRARHCPGLEKVASFIYTYTIVIAGDFGRCVVRQDDRELSAEARAEVRAYKRNVDLYLRSFIQEGINDGTIRSCDVKITAFSIAGAVNSLAHWFKPDADLSAKQVAAAFAKTLTEGIANRRATKFRIPDFDHQSKPGASIHGNIAPRTPAKLPN